MKVEIRVNLKEQIHDPEGNAIASALHSLGFDQVLNCRTGKIFYIDIADNIENPEEQIQKMCESLLSNPVTENYSFKILSKETLT